MKYSIEEKKLEMNLESRNEEIEKQSKRKRQNNKVETKMSDKVLKEQRPKYVETLKLCYL